MKTPCLKCGLIHEEPTAICDGYVGFDPDDTASDSKKQAAARIRAILASVPIEKRPAGRSGRRNDSASAVAEMKPPTERTSVEKALDRAAGRSTDDAARMAEQELPEWRREVSERLESYRQRRERQTRAAQAGQSVLEFRVHSKKDAEHGGLMAEEMSPSAPAVSEETPADLSAPPPDLTAHSEAAEYPADSSAAHAAFESEPSQIVPLAMAAAAGAGMGVSPANGRGVISTLPGEAISRRAPVDVQPPALDSTEAEDTGDSAADADTAVQQFEDLAYPTAEREPELYVPESDTPIEEDHEPFVAAEDTSALESASVSGEETAPADALPLSAEPGIVLADPSTLELHADSIEAEEVVSSPAAAAQPASELAPAMPAIDTEYWRTAPGIEPEPIAEPEVEECGSLTSGIEARSALSGERIEEISAQIDRLEQEELEETEGEPELLESAAEVAPEAEPAVAFTSAVEANQETTLAEGEAVEADLEPPDPYRESLRTASRRTHAEQPERIEINVPQPVFDFSPADALAEHPQDQQVPVADLRERRCAGAIDAVILALTIGAFFLAFHFAGGEVQFSRVGAAVVVAASFLIYAQYFLLFTLTAGATPGMMLRGLRVVCFDGTAPGSLELSWRAFGSLLSAAAGMLGFIWAAWDEDGLTWHDRISQSYITYAGFEAQPVHTPIEQV